MTWTHASGRFDLSHCLVMGVVNRTPDSFYDGGRMGLGNATDHALRLADEGASILDLGAVKAGPGSHVSEEEELARLLPLVELLATRVSLPLCVETGRPSVARRALEAGASIVNDVTGLLDDQLAEVCAEFGGGLIIMHNGGQIRGRPRHPRYADVVADVLATWTHLEARAQAKGVSPGAIAVDPGLDFGKTAWHSLELVRRLEELVAEGRPVLVAPSRKDVVGETLNLPPEERLAGTLAVLALAVAKGAAIVRVHDVAAAVDVVAMVEAVMGRRFPAAAVRGLWD